jgi:signal transduction histidine kinase
VTDAGDPGAIGLLARYRRLLETTRQLASTLDLNALLNQIVQAAADLTDAEAASILLYDPAKRELYFDAATNLTAPLMRGLIVPVESSLAGWIMTHNEPVVIADTQVDPRHFSGIARQTHITTESMLGVPLMVKERPIGVLEAINKLHGQFDAEDVDLLMALGAQAAVAIENARLFQQSDLISELVHEIRTPLTSLNMAARLMQGEASAAGRAQLVAIVAEETNRLGELTTAFLDLARLESGRAPFQVQAFAVAEMLAECVQLMQGRAAADQMTLTIEVAPDLPRLRGDRDKLKQVILNLVSNAIKYNRPGGAIRVQAVLEADEWRLTVRDTGVGIPEESLGRVFEKFYRVPGAEGTAQGTGLGLAICKQIVEAHGGQITVASILGEGTTFSVCLPRGEV